MKTHWNPKSSNSKTGDIPVSTSSRDTCPAACPFMKNGCYADSGPLALHWNKVTSGDRGLEYSAFLNEVRKLPDGQLWRHNQAGDLPGDQVTIHAQALHALSDANKGKKGFTYTHYDVLENQKNRQAIKAANKAGFTVNLSGNSLQHADRLKALDIGPVVAVITPDMPRQGITPAGNKYTACPAENREDVTCKSCGLCQKQRDIIVAFTAHGTSKKKVINLVKVAA